MLGARLRDECVEECDRFLRASGRREDGAIVGLHHLEPMLEVRRVIDTRLGGDAELGAEEGTPEFRDLS